MKKYGLICVFAGVTSLAGCSQAPAPVLSGYKGTYEVEKEPAVVGDKPVQKVAAASTELPAWMGGNKKDELDVKAEVEPAAGPSEQKISEEAVVEAAPKVKKIEEPKVELIQYTTKASDTAYSLASKFDTSVKDILEQNHLKAVSDVRQGMTLTIPSHSKPSVSAWQQVKDMLAESSSTVPATEKIAKNDAPPAKIETLAAVEPAAGRAPVPLRDGVVLIDHQVVPGETIYRISRTYDASVLDIMSANSFAQPQDLKAGTVVKVPVNQKVAVKNTSEDGVVVQPTAEKKTDVQTAAVVEKTEVAESEKVDEKPAEKTEQIAGQSSEDNVGDQAAASKAAKENVKPEAKVATSAEDDLKAELKRGQVDPVAAKADGLVWPVKGQILRRFGEEGNGVAHTGINIAVPVGTPVLAMDGGTVLYADDGLKTYGKMVLIRHNNGMVSAYAHNNHLLVRRGEKVKKGQIIATSGASGNVDVPQLHFELRRHASALDPMRELPKL